MVERNIGIIGDGATDRLIFGKIVQCILSEGDTNLEFNIVELQQNIHNFIDRYKNSTKSNNDYFTLCTQASTLEKEVSGNLWAAFDDFAHEILYPSYCDILLLTTDSEIVLAKADDYFQARESTLRYALSCGVNQFYNTALHRGYSYENIPIVIPIVTFPSTEILIAAAKGLDNKCYGKKPKDLKLRLYGTDDLRELSEEDLTKNALDFITIDGIKKMFNSIPEARDFIQTLSLGRLSCLI